MPDPYSLNDATWEDLKTRFTYHAPNPEKDQVQRYTQIRRMALEFAARICAMVPPGRERSLALTNLEQAVMYANAGHTMKPQSLKPGRLLQGLLIRNHWILCPDCGKWTKDKLRFSRWFPHKNHRGRILMTLVCCRSCYTKNSPL